MAGVTFIHLFEGISCAIYAFLTCYATTAKLDDDIRASQAGMQ